MIIQADEGWAGKPHLNFLFTEVKLPKGKLEICLMEKVPNCFFPSWQISFLSMQGT